MKWLAFLTVATIFEAAIGTPWVVYWGVLAIAEIIVLSNRNPDDGWIGIPSSEIKYRITHKRRYEEMLTRSRYYAAVGNDNMAEFERHVARHYARLVRMEVFRLGRP